MKIRRAGVNDADSIRQLYRDTILSVSRRDYGQRQVEIWSAASRDRDAWIEKIREQYFLIAEKDDATVGFGSVTDAGYVDYMFTHKDHQGRGIAKALLVMLEEYAESLNLNEIWAEVSITARPFFSSKGYVISERFVKTVCGVDFDDCIMTKKLR